jgi:RNA polymerase sigma factor (sigma-70 family)
LLLRLFGKAGGPVVTLKEDAYGAGEPGQSLDVGLATRAEIGSGTIALGEYSDLALVASLGNESGDAYAELYRRHASSVTAAARTILMDDGHCEDVVADVFVRLWFFPEQFDPRRGSLLTFLRLKARNRSIDIVRSESSRRRREAGGRDAENHHHNDADARLVGAESAVAVREALALLPVLEREPIYLAYFVGLTYREVAKRLSLPEGTVKARIRAGLSHLQGNEQLRLLRDVNDVAPRADQNPASPNAAAP